MRKYLFLLFIAIPFLFWSLWIAIPATAIKTMLEDSAVGGELWLEVKGIKKGLFFNLSIDNMTFYNSGKSLVVLSNISGQINPLKVFILRIVCSFDGGFSGGRFSGHMDISKGSIRAEIGLNQASIADMRILSLAGVKGTGKISGQVRVQGDIGHVEFVTEEAKFEPAFFQGIMVPMNLFHKVTGSIEVRGNTINITSLTLEGKDIYARLKGNIKGKFIDAEMEIIPGKSLIENPLFIYEFDRYKVSPGYYVMPLKMNLTS
ncbi:MAG: type II secretion system protein GspN [Nitrospirota bacterium]